MEFESEACILSLVPSPHNFFYIGSLILSFVTLVIFWRKGKSKRNDCLESLPGPVNLPIIGGILPFAGKQRDLLPKLIQMCEKYGPIWKLNFLIKPVVILNSAPFTQCLLSSTEFGHLTKPSILYKFIFGDMLGDGLITSDGLPWKGHRTSLGRAFTYKRYRNYVQIFNKHSNHLLHGLRKQVQHGQSYPNVIHLLHDVGFKVITETTFGEPDEQYGEIFFESISRSSQIFGYRMEFPILAIKPFWMLHPSYWEYTRHQKNLNQVTAQLIQRRKANWSPDTEDESAPRALIDEMLDGNMTDKEIHDECNTMIAAGSETTSWTMLNCLFFLAVNPQIQAECREEVQRMFQLNEEVTVDTLAEMRILERCILETLRVTPPIGTVFRILETPLKLDDKITLPVGTPIVVTPLALHKNPEYFPNPEKFNPDRFLPENVAKRHPYAFIPFSLGPRGCIGNKFAILEMKTVLSHILANFEVSTEDKPEDIKWLPQIIIKPETVYKLKFKSHSK